MKVTLAAASLSALMALPSATSAQQTADECIRDTYNAIASTTLEIFKDEFDFESESNNDIVIDFTIDATFDHGVTSDIAEQCRDLTGDTNSTLDQETVTIEMDGSRFTFEGP